MDATELDRIEFLKQQQREQRWLEHETRMRIGECRGDQMLAQALLVMALKEKAEGKDQLM